MNLNKLRANVGWLFKLQPPAIHLDPIGRQLPCRDEDWILREVGNDETFTLGDVRAPILSTRIGADVVHHFDTDRSRGSQHGFLMLKQQMYIQNEHIFFRMCMRPGERLDPPPVAEPERVPVSYDFIRTSGIHTLLESAGFEVNGVVEIRLPELEQKGWERVIENDRHGKPTLYYIPDSHPGMNLIFIKKRKPTPPQNRVLVPRR